MDFGITKIERKDSQRERFAEGVSILLNMANPWLYMQKDCTVLRTMSFGRTRYLKKDLRELVPGRLAQS